MPLAIAMSETRTSGSEVALALTGELDLASCGPLQTRLTQLAAAGVMVRLDLSRLEFIDSSGVHLLVDACLAARRDGWRFEVEPELGDQVRRVVELVGIARVLWP